MIATLSLQWCNYANLTRSLRRVVFAPPVVADAPIVLPGLGGQPPAAA